MQTEAAGTDSQPRGSFTPGPYDVGGHVKEAAARFVESAGSWSSTEPHDPVARLGDAGYPADLVAVAAPLMEISASEARTTVVYPQYGGLTDTSASVIVLARQELRRDGGNWVREVILDVRMARATGGTWQVASTVDPARPAVAPPRPGGPTPLGHTVLDSRAITVPEPGRADIAERRVDDRILSVLVELSRTFTLDVHVLVTGHPGTVFPIPRLSNHAVGRAVDIRAINGGLVSCIPRDDPLLAEFMVAAGRAGATEVGGPRALAGRGYFGDAVHQDHFHLGITPTKPPAAPNVDR